MYQITLLVAVAHLFLAVCPRKDIKQGSILPTGKASRLLQLLASLHALDRATLISLSRPPSLRARCLRRDKKVCCQSQKDGLSTPNSCKREERENQVLDSPWKYVSVSSS
jgi:hypothetical protein